MPNLLGLLRNNKIFEEIYGKHLLTGVCTCVYHPFDTNANGFAIELNGISVFIFEDPDDGYRSSAETPHIVGAPFSHRAINLLTYRDHVPIKIQKHHLHNFDGIEIIDTRNKKIIIEMGTECTDDYYPSFVGRWMPENVYDGKSA